jgi:hypothetical protein
MKSPHTQRPDDQARVHTNEFIAKYARSTDAAERAKVAAEEAKAEA